MAVISKKEIVEGEGERPPTSSLLKTPLVFVPSSGQAMEILLDPLPRRGGLLRPIIIFGLALLISILAFAKDQPLTPKLQPVYEVLKELPVDYKPEGAVCEQIARLEAHQVFPQDQFLVVLGVEYHVGAGTLGELDLVVVDKSSRKVTQVAEVKCWGNLYNALDKAKAQQDRFLWNLSQFPNQIRFLAEDSGVELNIRDFGGIKEFVFISQQGGLRRGFHQEMPYTLSEIHELRAKLVRCQNQGECPGAPGKSGTPGISGT